MEPEFYTLSNNLTRSAQLPGAVGASLNQLFAKQKLLFHRRYLAVLRGIEVTQNGVNNAFGKNLYTEAIWRAEWQTK